MTTISGAGAGAGVEYTNTVDTNRQKWLDDQARVDATYNVKEAKSYETLSKAQIKASADPFAQYSRMKITDGERSILSEVAKLNGWSRQATEDMYKMSVASFKDTNSIGDFLKNLTHVEPGYFGKDGGIALGLTEADRRRIMGIPQDYEEPVIDEVDKALASNKVTTVVEAMNKSLTDEEHTALSQAAQLNGVNEESAVAYYKMYLAQHDQPSMTDFLQLLSQNEPNSYGKDGGLQQNDDDDSRVIRVTV